MGREKGSFQIVAPLTSMMVFCVAILLSSVQTAKAQQGLSLIPPYYGTRNINSYFDHRYPTYNRYPNTTYPNVVIYTGEDNPSGNPYWYDGHDGYDFDLVYERVLAAASGQVVFAGWANPSDRTESYGLHIRVNHGNGYQTRYGHLSAAAVSGGQQVLSGQVIATSGNTGDSSGPHLHFDLYHNAQPTDPFGWSGGYTDPWQSWSGETSYCLWADGEWANICGGVARAIPAPADGATIIVDDTADNSGGFSKGSGGPFNNPCPPGSCPYWSSAATGYGNDMWWTHVNPTADYWARWTPAIPQQGIYEVWVHVPNVNATTWQAQYTIAHVDGQSTAIVDQEGLNNQWVSLGVYRLHEGSGDAVYLTDVTGESDFSRRVGVDAVKFVRRAVTYLPDVKSDSGGWSSSIIVRNNGGAAFIDIKFYYSSGGLWATYTYPNLAGQGVWEIVPALSGFSGSAVVDASQDVATVVESQHAGYTMAAAYTGEAQPATIAYLPAFYKVSTISSLFTVQNPAPVAADVSMAYRDRNGNDKGTMAVSLPAGGSRTFDPYTYGDVPPAVYDPSFVDGSVRITADQPIVALATTLWKTAEVPYEAGQYNAPTVGRTTLYAPSQYRLCTPDPDGNCSPSSTWTLYSAIILNNLTANAAYVTLNYYRRVGGTLDLTITDTIPPYSAHGYNTRNGGSVDWTLFRALGAAWDGTVRVTTSQAVAGVVNTIWANLSSAGTYNLAGPEDGRATVIFPLQAKQAPGGVWQRWSAINVMNVGAQTVTVAVNYYNQWGTLVLGPVNRTLTPYQAFGLNTTSADLSGLPGDFVGSAVAQTTAPALIGVANVIYPDRAVVYDGVGR